MTWESHMSGLKLVGFSFAEQLLVCPFCPCEQVHPTAVRVSPVHGCVEYRVTHAGLTAAPSDAATHANGVSIVFSFSCESGHDWDAIIEFRHGSTGVFTELVRHRTTEADMLDAPQTIWRT